MGSEWQDSLRARGMWTTNHPNNVPAEGSELEACSSVLKEKERYRQMVEKFTKHTRLLERKWIKRIYSSYPVFLNFRSYLELELPEDTKAFHIVVITHHFLFLSFPHPFLGLENSFSLFQTKFYTPKTAYYLFWPLFSHVLSSLWNLFGFPNSFTMVWIP